MKATGIVRRIDDLGRVVIPKEIRRTMRIREGDPLEIYTDAGEVIFKKYSAVGEMSGLASHCAEALAENTSLPVIICDRDHCISDNAGLMCINFLKKIGIKEVVLAGFDGFSQNGNENFYDNSMAMSVEAERLMRMNTATSKKLKQLKSQFDITFLTDSVYGK